MEFLGDLLQGAVWLLCIGAVAVIVIAAIAVAAVRRATGRTAPGETEILRPESVEGQPVPHSDPLAGYQGGDARTTTESTAATSADPMIGSSGDLEERNRNS